MIEAKDIRVGNLIMFSTIHFANHHTIRNLENNAPMKAKPLKITVGFLLAHGWKQVNTLHDGTLVYHGEPYLYWKDGSVTIAGMKTKNHLRFIHELQNLIYYNRGSEMEISLEWIDKYNRHLMNLKTLGL